MKVVAILVLALVAVNANFLQNAEAELSDVFDHLKGRLELL